MKEQFRVIALDAELKRINIGKDANVVRLDVRNPLDCVHYFVTLPPKLDAYERKLAQLLSDDDGTQRRRVMALLSSRAGRESDDGVSGLAEAPLDVALIWQAPEDPEQGGPRAVVGATGGEWLGGSGERLWGV